MTFPFPARNHQANSIAALALDLWYDPSDLSTLFQSSGGTTAVGADGDPVGYLGNKGASGSTMNATQATSGKRPLYKSSAGLSWLLGDGVDDFLATSGALSNFMSVTDLDLMIAFQCVTITTHTIGSSWYINAPVLTNPSDESVVLASSDLGTSTPTIGFGHYGTGQLASQALVAATDAVARITHAGGNITIAIDGGSTTTTASGNTASVAHGLALFGWASASHYGNARIYGAAARKTAFSSGEAAALLTYLAAKQGRVL